MVPIKNGESIFSKGNDPSTFVISFTRSPRKDFSIFGKGYFRAATSLAKPLLDNHTSFPDYDGYPIVFLLRHSLELYLKGCLNQISLVAALTKNEDLARKLSDDRNNHHLCPLASLLQETLYILFPEDTGLFEVQKKIITIASEFDAIDRESYAFRYPTNKHHEASTKKHLSINLRIMVDMVSEIIEYLDTIDMMLDAKIDAAEEMFEEFG